VTTLDEELRQLNVAAELADVESRIARLKEEMYREQPNETVLKDLMDQVKSTHRVLKSKAKAEYEKKEAKKKEEEEKNKETQAR